MSTFAALLTVLALTSGPIVAAVCNAWCASRHTSRAGDGCHEAHHDVPAAARIESTSIPCDTFVVAVSLPETPYRHVHAIDVTGLTPAVWLPAADAACLRILPPHRHDTGPPPNGAAPRPLRI